MRVLRELLERARSLRACRAASGVQGASVDDQTVWADGAPTRHETGSAVVDFVLVGALAVIVFLAIIQLALVLHVRNTLLDAAASGARYGILADRGPADAQERTTQLITSTLGSTFAQNVQVNQVSFNGVDTLAVTVRAPLPVIGLLGPGGLLEVTGHAAVQH